MEPEHERLERVLCLEIPGATPEQIAAGLAAANDTLAYAGVDAELAFDAYVARSAWRLSQGTALSELQLECAAFFTVAQLAAFDLVIRRQRDAPRGITPIRRPRSSLRGRRWYNAE